MTGSTVRHGGGHDHDLREPRCVREVKARACSDVRAAGTYSEAPRRIVLERQKLRNCSIAPTTMSGSSRAIQATSEFIFTQDRDDIKETHSLGRLGISSPRETSFYRYKGCPAHPWTHPGKPHSLVHFIPDLNQKDNINSVMS